MTSPTISVILPVHNESEYLAPMLESLQGQSYSSWEAVIVDDGSTDDTVSIVKERSGTDPRIRLVASGTKLGKVAAFNLAFRESRGDLVCHVGGDDIVPAQGLQHRVESLSGAQDRAVSFGKLQFIDSHGDLIGTPIPRGDNGSQSSPGATYTRALADLIFPVPESLPSEDIWLGNAARACGQVRHTHETVTHYRRHTLNSNPRHKPFQEMSDSIGARMKAYEELLNSELPIPEASSREFRNRLETERLRSEGATASLLMHRNTAIVDRLALASMSHPALWKIRQKLGAHASGWRTR